MTFKPDLVRLPRVAATAIALSLGLALAGCGGMAVNRSLESNHQPIVERTNYTLDLNTGYEGLPYPEQRRLAGWFEALDLHYGDRVAIDDPTANAQVRADVAALVGRYGLLIADGAPVTNGYVNAGTARVVVSRSSASVPGCPNWNTKSDANLRNGTNSNYGCASNANLAAMVANPEHLLKGDAGTGETVIMSSNKAIDSYREQKPTGERGLKAENTSGK